MRPKIFKLALLFVLFALCYTAVGMKGQMTLSSERESFTDSLKSELQGEVTAVFKKNCSTSGCHGGNYPKANLNLEPDRFLKVLANVPSIKADSQMLVDIKKPENSYLVKKIRGDEGIAGARMPLQGKPLKDEEVAVIQLWIYSLHVLGTD